jgi:glycosyltransferase involved in cell wall biosynthesis
MAMTGTVVEGGKECDPGSWLAEQSLMPEFFDAQASATSMAAAATTASPFYRLTVADVQVVLHRSPTSRPHALEEPEITGFLGLLEGVLDEFRPDLLINFGVDSLAVEIRRRARARGIVVVVALHDFNYRGRDLLQDLDAVIVPSQFAASYYRRALDLTCSVLPCPMPIGRSRALSREPRYVMFVNPSHEKGVFAFARIADELGRRRPDIPILVVEGSGTERTLVDCDLDLRAHGNVSVMAHTPDPRVFSGVTRICLMPSLRWESQPLVAIEAMINGVPAVGSDLGGMPEALGDSGSLDMPRNHALHWNPSALRLPIAHFRRERSTKRVPLSADRIPAPKAVWRSAYHVTIA